MSSLPAAMHGLKMCTLLAGIGLLALVAMLTPVGVRAADPPAGTIPPVAPFDKYVEPFDEIRSGERITFTIQVRNEITPAYSATIGITDTLSPLLQILPESVFANSGSVDVGSGVLTWIGDIQSGSEIAIRYAITAPPAITESLLITNVTSLYEIRNHYVPTPTSQVTETIRVIAVRPWHQFLPLAVRQKDALPQLRNPGFEDQPNQAWSELVDGQPGKLIYSTSEFYRPLRDGIRYAWLGGAPNQVNKLEQIIQLPAGYDHIGLRFYYWLYSEEDDCGNDLVRVQVDGVTLNSGEFQLCKQNGTYQAGNPDGWVQKVLDLSSHGDKKVAITFWSRLNGSRNSNFLVDAVQLCSNDADAPNGVPRCPNN